MFTKPVDDTQADKDTSSSEWLSLDSRNHPTQESLKESEMFNQEKKNNEGSMKVQC